MGGKICGRGIGLEPGVKERGSYGWWEWGVDTVRRSGRSMNRKDRDTGAEMRLTDRTRKLIPETRRGVPKGAIGYEVRCVTVLHVRQTGCWVHVCGSE